MNHVERFRALTSFQEVDRIPLNLWCGSKERVKK